MENKLRERMAAYCAREKAEPDTEAIVLQEHSDDEYMAISDTKEGVWPHKIRVMASCGCVLHFKVVGQWLNEEDTVVCGRNACMAESTPALQCAYAYLETLKGVK